ncbi:AraC family transcriptional regulator [Paraburkholderia acidisoli]|uniref:Helix-turn-helix domain-containing protein n=1 Tax=Paraburkholderia acidisoli TaxID=2571748 RepID=A0A7Z2JH61_9BURK|nr:AraC family transcriptional regulator [Paraburkholderia acidisoli]QGZ63069.1 helix-turn-helix domain-containing protein [Paraburkholderia acidisoli]
MIESVCTDRFTAPAAAQPSAQPSADSIVLQHAGLDDPSRTADDAAEERLVVSRWTSGQPEAWHTVSGTKSALVTLCLRQSLLTLKAGETLVYDGVIDRGGALLVPPACAVHAMSHTPADFLHVSVPESLLAGWLDGAHDPALTALPGAALYLRDGVIGKLTDTLLRAFGSQTSARSIYADGITLSIIARLLEVVVARFAVKPVRAPSVSPLEAWRVKMAIDFIDERIDQNLTLAELGAAVGLSPMHFAARFRAATGSSPHTFVLRRRIEHAQLLLATTTSTVADIAFSVGFRTQAHFTSVFRRHVDDTPHRWRGKQGVSGGGLAAN